MLRLPSALSSAEDETAPVNSSGRTSGAMPSPLSATSKRAESPSRRRCSSTRVVEPPCSAAFSIRLMSTCSIKMASIGIISSSSGARMETVISGKRLRNLTLAALSSSSPASSSLWMVDAPEMRVTESRFSTTPTSHCASVRMSVSRAVCVSGVIRSPESKMAFTPPTMLVRGVRISCETARSRLPRIFSFSASARSFSCCLICVVSALTTMDTASMTRNVSG